MAKNNKPKLGRTVVYFIIIILAALRLITDFLAKLIHPLKFLSLFFQKIINAIDKTSPDTISFSELVNLSIKNLKIRRTRTIVTIGGMAIGIATIVFLVSIGFGLEKMVISRVARLDEMKQSDVSPQTGSKLKLTDKSLADFRDIPNVVSVQPLIAVVGRLNFNKSITDFPVYGVTGDYLKQSAINQVKGELFTNNDISSLSPEDMAKIKNNQSNISLNQEISQIKITQVDGQWLKLKKDANQKSSIVGYIKKTSQYEYGTLVWGEYYSSDTEKEIAISTDNEKLSKWIKLKLPLWEKSGESYQPQEDQDGNQKIAEGYLPADQVSYEEIATVAEIDINNIDFSENSNTETEISKVSVNSIVSRQAVVNRSLLQIIGLNESEAVGQEIKLSFIVTGDLIQSKSTRIESDEISYKIVAVTPSTSGPIIYVPFKDLRSLGIDNFSQAKIVARSEDNLPKVRQQIEVLGYSTRSVADTVSQINSLFSTARIIFGVLGIIALSVAGLGMFNTLTVSLLERTREVGLMKAMGMKSKEVKYLFMAEALLIATIGGIVGLLGGYLIGQIISLVLSIFSLTKGVGYINLTFIPMIFVIFILIISLIVGIFTGIFPAKRATKISALNALRYE